MSSSTVINTNVRALNSHRNLTGVGSRQDKASRRLSSGKKINSAADDAAGLAISTKMKAQIMGLDMAYKNTQDATSLIQTAEGSLSEINNMVKRIRELTVQASTDTNTGGEASDRAKMADEVDQLLEEITNMAGRTEFNTKVLTTGDYAVGANAVDVDGKAVATNVTQVDIATVVKESTSGASKTLTGGKAVSLDGGESFYTVNSRGVVEVTDVATLAGYLDDPDGNLSDDIKVLTSNDLKVSEDGVLYFKGGDGKVYGINSADFSLTTGAADLDTLLKNNKDELLYDKSSLTFQVGANNRSDDAKQTRQSITMNLASVTADELFQKLDKEGNIVNAQGAVSDVLRNDASTADDIAAVLDVIDSGLDVVTSQVSKLGAIQNRLEYTANNLQVSSENLNQANSRIEDADMAKEMTNLTAANVINQAAVAMLAQANQAPQNILQLLG